MNTMINKKYFEFSNRPKLRRYFIDKNLSSRCIFTSKQKNVKYNRPWNTENLFDGALLKSLSAIKNYRVGNKIKLNSSRKKNNFLYWIIKISVAESLLRYLVDSRNCADLDAVLSFGKKNHRLISFNVKRCVTRLLLGNVIGRNLDKASAEDGAVLKLKKNSILFKLACSGKSLFSNSITKRGTNLRGFRFKNGAKTSLKNFNRTDFLGQVSIYEPVDYSKYFVKSNRCVSIAFPLKYLSLNYLLARLGLFKKSYFFTNNFLILNNKFNKFKYFSRSKGRRSFLLDRTMFSFSSFFYSKVFFNIVLKNKNTSNFLTSFLTRRRSYNNLTKNVASAMLSNRGFYRVLTAPAYELALVKPDNGLPSIPQNVRQFSGKTKHFRAYKKILLRHLFSISNKSFRSFNSRTAVKWLQRLVDTRLLFNQKTRQNKKLFFFRNRVAKTAVRPKRGFKGIINKGGKASRGRAQRNYNKLFGFNYSNKFVKNIREHGYDLARKYEFDLSGGFRFHRSARAADMGTDEMYKMDARYIQEFIYKKKSINKYFIESRYNIFEKHDIQPQKYFFLNAALDPIYGSFLLNKIINVFSKHGCKKRIRNIFYDILFDEESEIDIFTMYQIIADLRPDFLNVKARRGSDVYTAPIEASETKSIMKAIKFFKKAVYARKTELTLAEKIYMELWQFTYWDDFTNPFYEDYVNQAKSSMHLRHFRSQKKY